MTHPRQKYKHPLIYKLQLERFLLLPLQCHSLLRHKAALAVDTSA